MPSSLQVCYHLCFPELLPTTLNMTSLVSPPYTGEVVYTIPLYLEAGLSFPKRHFHNVLVIFLLFFLFPDQLLFLLPQHLHCWSITNEII